MSNLLTTGEVAKMLGVLPNTIERWRCQGKGGPLYIKAGTRVRYRKEDVEAYMQERLHSETEEYPTHLDPDRIELSTCWRDRLKPLTQLEQKGLLVENAELRRRIKDLEQQLAIKGTP